MSAPTEVTAVDLAVFPIALAALGSVWFFVGRKMPLDKAPDRSGVVGPQLTVVGWSLVAARLLAMWMASWSQESLKELPEWFLRMVQAMGSLSFTVLAALFAVGLFIGMPQSFNKVGLRGRGSSLAWRIGLWFIPLGLLVVTGFSNAALYLWWKMGQSLPEVGHEAFKGMEKASFEDVVKAFLGAVVVAPLMEEFIFRGFLQTGVQSLLPAGAASRWKAICLTALAFGLVHVGAVPPPNIPCLVVFGVLLGWAYEVTGCLWVPMAIHAGFNFVSFIVGYQQVRASVGQ